MPRNVIVAQSGGPTAVINSSLRGVVEACRDQPSVFGKVLGGWHGIEGVLKEELLDLSAQDPREIALLTHTPAAGAIGTCRYKLKESRPQDFERAIEVMKAHDVGYFFYIGGNDSMDTAYKISRAAAARGLSLVATGVPKTIDNDLGDPKFALIDHTPGYGSVARYWACAIADLDQENRGSSPADPVLVVQAMGRHIGFIPAAARLADPRREMPLLICLPEARLTLDEITHAVHEMLKRQGRCVLVVSEGLDLGDVGSQKDAFGHVAYSASQITVQQMVVNHLNARKLPVPGAARGQTPGTAQRNSALCASTVDLEEARELGRRAVAIAAREGNGWMSTLIRPPGPTYAVRYDKAPLEQMANSERRFPLEWIDKSRTDVTDDFVRYAQPLIGEEWARIPLENGLQRFARLEPVFADKKCATYRLA